MRRRLLLFLVTIDFVLVCAFAYCWGGGLVQFLGQNLSLKFYNGVLNLYVPGVLGAQEEGIPNIYRDVTASMYPQLHKTSSGCGMNHRRKTWRIMRIRQQRKTNRQSRSLRKMKRR